MTLQEGDVRQRRGDSSLSVSSQPFPFPEAAPLVMCCEVGFQPLCWHLAGLGTVFTAHGFVQDPLWAGGKGTAGIFVVTAAVGRKMACPQLLGAVPRTNLGATATLCCSQLLPAAGPCGPGGAVPELGRVCVLVSSWGTGQTRRCWGGFLGPSRCTVPLVLPVLPV